MPCARLSLLLRPSQHVFQLRHRGNVGVPHSAIDLFKAYGCQVALHCSMGELLPMHMAYEEQWSLLRGWIKGEVRTVCTWHHLCFTLSLWTPLDLLQTILEQLGSVWGCPVWTLVGQQVQECMSDWSSSKRSLRYLSERVEGYSKKWRQHQ